MRLNIDINLYVPEDIILSNRNEKLQKDEIEVPVPEFLQPVADAIYDSIEDHGFKFDFNRKPRFSKETKKISRIMIADMIEKILN